MYTSGVVADDLVFDSDDANVGHIGRPQRFAGGGRADLCQRSDGSGRRNRGRRGTVHQRGPYQPYQEASCSGCGLDDAG